MARVRFVTVTILVLVLAACVLRSHRNPGPTEVPAPDFRVVVHMDGGFPRTALSLEAPDGDVAWQEAVSLPDNGSDATLVSPRDWYRGPGDYRLHLGSETLAAGELLPGIGNGLGQKTPQKG